MFLNQKINFTTSFVKYYILSLHCGVVLAIFVCAHITLISCFIISILQPVLIKIRWFYQEIFKALRWNFGIPLNNIDMQGTLFKNFNIYYRHVWKHGWFHHTITPWSLPPQNLSDKKGYLQWYLIFNVTYYIFVRFYSWHFILAQTTDNNNVISSFFFSSFSARSILSKKIYDIQS